MRKRKRIRDDKSHDQHDIVYILAILTINSPANGNYLNSDCYVS